MSYQNRMGRNRNGSRYFSTASSRSNPRRGSGRNQKKYIDPARFVQVATMQTQAAYVPTHRFSDFALADVLQTNLTQRGYDTPSPIQDQTIPAALTGRDIIGVASTGTGKTAAFALPVLNQLIANPGSKAIVVAPTRELAEQIEQEFRQLGRSSDLMGSLLIGGTNMAGQLRDLRHRPEIVIGTPGRIKDHLNRGSLQLNDFNLVVLDEVDRMLDMGFVRDVTEILANTNANRQSMFFSATMDPKVRQLINSFATDPLMVSLKPSLSSENVHQDVVKYHQATDKIDKLHNILLNKDVAKVIVFDDTQRSVEKLARELSARGFASGSIHGGKSQGQRKKALDSFKKNQFNILVATDVAARGLDVADISHVINYSTPNDYEDYVHRIGRAGRAGRVGYALTFVAQ